jgi:transposase-like protein
MAALSGALHAQHAGPRPEGAALIRTVFATSLERRFGAVADMLRDAREELCAFASFPQAH